MLFGEGWLNKNWAANGAAGTLASFTVYAGGGIDTPLSKHFSLRVEGGWEHTNFALKINSTSLFPYYRIPGLPSDFARFSTGIVWAPRLARPASAATSFRPHHRRRRNPKSPLKRHRLSATGTSNQAVGGATSMSPASSTTGTPGANSLAHAWITLPRSCHLPFCVSPPFEDEFGDP